MAIIDPIALKRLWWQLKLKEASSPASIIWLGKRFENPGQGPRGRWTPAAVFPSCQVACHVLSQSKSWRFIYVVIRLQHHEDLICAVCFSPLASLQFLIRAARASLPSTSWPRCRDGSMKRGLPTVRSWPSCLSVQTNALPSTLFRNQCTPCQASSTLALPILSGRCTHILFTPADTSTTRPATLQVTATAKIMVPPIGHSSIKAWK